jgi:hypothetical protein
MLSGISRSLEFRVHLAFILDEGSEIFDDGEASFFGALA